MLQKVEVIIRNSVRGLCVRPYPLHPKGCPNFGKHNRCPPNARLYEDVYDLSFPVFAIINEFDLAAHVNRMKSKHPQWSNRQLRCVLYWQGTARKALKDKILLTFSSSVSMKGYSAETCPEAMGVDVTTTLANIGIELEWPPVNIARQVALIGKKRGACLKGEGNSGEEKSCGE